MNKQFVLDDARTLALFSNLTDESSECFRQNYPDFVPGRWWRAVHYELPGFQGDYEITNSTPSVGNENTLWRLWQKLLQESWTKLTADRIIALLTMWSSREESVESADSEVPGVSIPTAHPYQRAIMFLAMEPWRAIFCEKCGQRFVKENPRQRFCSEACFHVARKAYKRGLWADNSPKWLENRKRRKTERR